jgi:CubicO group peptidase (beta-lactamase class C family)
MSIDLARLQVAFDRVAEGVEEGAVPTVVLAVANRREIVRCEAFSRADGDRVAADSIFLLASISKPILATAAMVLVAEGRLVLSEPIARYIPEFALSSAPAVTAWHLLTHTSGMDEIDWADTLRQRPHSASRFEVACRRALLFGPGERVSYSTLSYELLAALVTRLSDRPYQDYLRERIFAPLGMADTSYDPRVSDSSAGRMVPVQGIDGSGLADPDEALDYFIARQVAGAGLWSTAADLVAFGQAYLNDGQQDSHGAYQLLPPAYIDLMTREHTAGLLKMEDGRAVPAHYALSWRKGSLDGARPGSPRVFGHDGATGGLLWIDPEWDLVFVYLTNSFGSADAHVQQAALQAIYGALKW